MDNDQLLTFKGIVENQNLIRQELTKIMIKNKWGIEALIENIKDVSRGTIRSFIKDEKQIRFENLIKLISYIETNKS